MGLIRRGLIRTKPVTDARLRQRLFGVEFPNPIGLAAGFDKNGLALSHWHRLGFGFVEAGTATLHAQPGNPRPRLFRLPAHRALINRMGFNNSGSARLAERLAESHSPIPIGINIGKSKATELADAPADYRGSYEVLHRHGAYFVVNVSSPNTPGLRTLQDGPSLRAILAAMREVDAARPVLVKVAPDLEFDALDELVRVATEAGASGFIATNTTISRSGIDGPHANESGGLSGAPLADRASEVLRHLAAQVGPDSILIAAGGIFTAADAIERIAAGAHLVQLYTGWVYGGPSMVPDLLTGMLRFMSREGISDLSALRSSGIQPGTLPRQ